MQKESSFRDILLASGLYATSSIIGPLLLFGGFGWIVDNFFATGPWFMLVGVGIAFITTNALLFKKIMKLSGEMEAIGKLKEKKEK